jgi:replicative DNA helicase
MLSLAKTLRQEGNRGEALPEVFTSFTANGIKFRRGSLCMIAGVPGSYKTQVTLALADAWKVPTLYFSNDSDETTMASRLIARRMRIPTERIEERMHQQPQWASTMLTDTDHIKWNFNPNPTLPEVEEELDAFNEVFGLPPVLVVVDVLMKMNYTEDNEHSTALRIVDYLAGIARDYSACVILVHHASEAVQGNPVPPRAAILQKVSQLPALILNVAPEPWTKNICICAVKNRHGKQDPSGKEYFSLKTDPSQCWFEDMQ